MSFWDNVKKFAQPYSDDEFDDYEEDDYMEDYEEPVVERPASRRRRPAAAPVAPVVEEEDEAFSGFAAAPVAAPAPVAPAPAAAPAASSTFSGHVVNTAHGKQQEVVLFRPVNYNDASKAALDLRNRKVVVVNLENVDKALARRVVDFLSGCAFSVDGSVKKIAQSAYLFCPSHVGVNGDLESMQSEVESYV